MSETHPSGSAHSIVSQILINTDELLSLRLKYPHGKLCNIHKDNVKLFKQSAKLTGFKVEVKQDHQGLAMYVVGSLERDPKELFEVFRKLQVR